MSKLLEITELSTEIRGRQGVVRAVDGVSLSVQRGETLGVVGESGCGKTMTALSIVRLLPAGGVIASGSIKIDGEELVGASEVRMRAVRGDSIGVVFQDPMTSLNPSKTIGWQIAESLIIHKAASKAMARKRALEVLELVKIPAAAERLNDFPHQLSGGMRQRVMIAIALANSPELLIADEPTTALDVTIQAQILSLLDELKSTLNMGLILVTHDLGVVAGRADRVMVMYAGRVVESAETGRLFGAMRHPYTFSLFASIPRIGDDRERVLTSIPGLPPDLAHPPEGCRFAERCRFAQERCHSEDPTLVGEEHRYACWFPVNHEIRSAVVASKDRHAARSIGHSPLLELKGLVKEYDVFAGALRRKVGSVHAVSGIDLTLYEGETIGIVGESGCGKSTLGRMMVGLERPTSGQILYKGDDISTRSSGEMRRLRRNFQLMFQDPYASLDPRMRIGPALLEPVRVQHVGSLRDQEARMYELLDEVGLRRSAVQRYPHEFSGGQRQRVGFARALMLEPGLVVADEPVSALDVSIRSQVLNMMRRLQARYRLTYALISHDLSVVSYLADRIGVMYLGELVELASASDVFATPAHPYTRGLLRSVPIPDPAIEREKARVGQIVGELPSPLSPPSGCRFHPRCPYATDRCSVDHPELRIVATGHSVACHHAEQVLEDAWELEGLAQIIDR
jgi:oligopeptide/dipeptide ABC transporter ATP-binding protein